MGHKVGSDWMLPAVPGTQSIIWSRRKYFDNYWMKFLNKHSCFPENDFQSLQSLSGYFYSATMR